ncbi:MAG: paraquat-inducible protein A [Pseudomonadales bacterium]|nr:paraquat-inducible protein A [Pseudomonadales bacterium]
MTDSRLTAASQGLSSCHLCLKLFNHELHQCPRCNSAAHSRKPDSMQRTLAFLVTAAILYIPANTLPIMVTEQFGQPIESTILGGIVLLIEMGSLPVAVVIFIASIMIPLGKLIAMFYLCWSVQQGSIHSTVKRTKLYRMVEFIGKWSMIDVFVVALLVALIHLNGLLVIRPGLATIAFCAVVITSILAAESFDPRLIWDQMEEENNE